jgi:hypothetical protein
VTSGVRLADRKDRNRNEFNRSIPKFSILAVRPEYTKIKKGAIERENPQRISLRVLGAGSAEEEV